MDTRQNKNTSLQGKDAVYRMVTERIISLLENGTVPWHRPTYGTECKPMNYVSGKPYSGVNLLLLEPGEYLTFKQVSDLQGKVKKGAKACPVFFFRVEEKKTTDEKTGEEKTERRFIYRYYNTFRLEDTEGIQSRIKGYTPPRNPQKAAQSCVNNYLLSEQDRGLQVKDSSSPSALYDEESDTFILPTLSDEQMDDLYFSQMFREMVHSTGHKNRLDRKDYDTLDISNPALGKEELLREMGSSMLLNCAGYNALESLDNSAKYCEKWIKVLKGDVRLATLAATRAEKAVRYILDDDPDLVTTIDDELKSL